MLTFMAIVCIAGLAIVADDLFGFNYFKSQDEIDADDKYDCIVSTPLKCDDCGKFIVSDMMHYDEMTQELFCSEDCAFRSCEKKAMVQEPYGEPFAIPKDEAIALALEGMLKQQRKGD